MLSAATIQYIYNSKSFYYIIRIIYNITHGNRSPYNNFNKPKMKIDCVSMEFLEDKIIEEDNEKDNVKKYNLNDIYAAAKNLGNNGNWWKWKVWCDYYQNKMTYKQISQKYRLSVTPIFQAVKESNAELSQVLK